MWNGVDGGRCSDGGEMVGENGRKESSEVEDGSKVKGGRKRRQNERPEIGMER